jgi:thiamine-monophosphate kinase
MKKHPLYLDEFKLIERIAKLTKTGPSVVAGIGDDCAVLKYKKNRYMLFTADMIVEGIHFKKSSACPSAIGHKALAVNISDIAACGGIPRWAVVSAGIPRDTSADYISAIYQGINKLARRFDIDLVGGDTSRSDRLTLSVALLGTALKSEIVLRKGARHGDSLVLTGPISLNPDHLEFMPRLKESQYIVKHLMPSSMIDISDGLLSDLQHILDKSKKGAIVYESLLPISGKRSSIIKALNTGEQFQLIFTMPRRKLACLPRGFYPVGEISGTEPIITFVSRSGARRQIQPKGYVHFR